jgi:hypothetical protein
MSTDNIKTFAQGALGAMTFGMYHQYVTNNMMTMNNKIHDMEITKIREENTKFREELRNKKFFYFF